MSLDMATKGKNKKSNSYFDSFTILFLLANNPNPFQLFLVARY